MLHHRVEDDTVNNFDNQIPSQEKYNNTSYIKQKKRWKWIALGVAIAIAIIVVVIVVPVVVTQNRKKQQQEETGGGEEGGGGEQGPNVIDTGNSEYPVSAYANMIGIKTNNDPSLAAKQRVFVIGDIHGCVDEFNSLVEQLNFSADTDQLILAGDITSKGPDSSGVIRRAKELGALCVRGNHDDKVIRIKTFELQKGLDAMQPPSATMDEGVEVPDPLTFDNDHVQLALNLTQDEYEYLSSCPVILHLPQFNNSIVVHGGLDPNINSLEGQVPFLVMNMRDIDKDNQPSKDNDVGVQWAEEWNVYQDNSTINDTEIFYGHDASRGLNIQEHTFGVDTGCVYGRKLTAINMQTKELTSVKCKAYSK